MLRCIMYEEDMQLFIPFTVEEYGTAQPAKTADSF